MLSCWATLSFVRQATEGSPLHEGAKAFGGVARLIAYSDYVGEDRDCWWGIFVFCNFAVAEAVFASFGSRCFPRFQGFAGVGRQTTIRKKKCCGTTRIAEGPAAGNCSVCALGYYIGKKIPFFI